MEVDCCCVGSPEMKHTRFVVCSFCTGFKRKDNQKHSECRHSLAAEEDCVHGQDNAKTNSANITSFRSISLMNRVVSVNELGGLHSEGASYDSETL